MHERSVSPEKERDLYVCVCLRERERLQDREGRKEMQKALKGVNIF